MKSETNNFPPTSPKPEGIECSVNWGHAHQGNPVGRVWGTKPRGEHRRRYPPHYVH